MSQIFSTTLIGHVPISPGGTTDFLRADQSWADPLGGLAIAATTYTPELTNVTNIDLSSAPGLWFYSRVGNIVSFSGSVDIDPTAGAGAATELGISPPIASAFTNAVQCSGVGASIKNDVGAISSDAANDRIAFRFDANFTAARSFYITGQYRVI